MNNFLDTILSNLDWVVVVIVLCSGFFQSRYLSGFTISKSNDSAIKTLLVSAVAAAIYISLLKNPENGKNWAGYFLSYFFATSLYELIVKPFTNWITSKVGQQ
jgi:hypothetical protein